MAESEEFVAISTPVSSKSDVWTYFGHPVYDRNNIRCTDKTHTVCKLCKTLLKHNGNTSNMRTHLVRHHPSTGMDKRSKPPLSVKQDEREVVSQIKSESAIEAGGQATSPVPQSQPTISSALKRQTERQTKYPDTSLKAKTLTKQIGRYLVSDMRPFSAIDNRHFKKMLEALEPKYSLPCRKHFREKVIPALYEETRADVEASLKQAGSVSITTDTWTSRATQSYMTVTAHFISDDWQIRNYVLTTRVISVAHTGLNIGNALKDVLQEWQLVREFGIAVVSDNAANMDIAAKTAELEPHIKCFAHTINLASQRGLKVNAMARLLGRIRRIVTFFHKSTTATSVLASKQLLLGIPQHKLVNDVPTRWNSSYDMIERFLEQQPALLCALTSSDVRRNASDIVTLSDDDINESERAIEVLKPLKAATAIMCNQHFPTVSLIYPLKAQIESSMVEKDTDSVLVKEVKMAVREDLAKRYTSNDIEAFLLLASALDPRFRSLPLLDSDRRDHVFQNVSENANIINSKNITVKAEKLEPEVQTVTEPVLPAVPVPQVLPPLPNLPGLSDSSDEEGPTPPKLRTMENRNPAASTSVDEPDPAPAPTSAMEDFFGEVYFVSETPAVALADRIDNEIREYRTLPNISVNENPLIWWSANANKFPLLSRLAMMVLGIPGTSVPSERVFSTAGDIVTATRSCLDPDLVDMLIFLKKNLKQ